MGVLWLLAFFIQWEGWAQGAAALPIGGFLNAEGRFTVLFSPTPGSYYILLKGATVTAVNEPVRVVLEVPADNLLSDAEAASGAAAFYRLQQVAVEAPLDVDGDGIDDVYELEHPGVLSALDGADAGLDPDGNGRTHLEEYRLATQELTTVAEMSPANGEAGVSVTRETIVRFSAALAANTAIDTGRFYAGFGGRKLLGRVELSSDRRTATLFYLEPIPGSTRIYGTFDGNGLQDELGRPIDADADGVPGGVLQFSFDTLSTTPVYGTAVIGRVFASEPKAAQAGGAVGETPTATGGTPVLPMPRRMLSALAQSYLPAQATAFTNLPLAGVTITVDGAEETIRTTTDAEGRFVLTNCPSGRFFVHIDGRTSSTGIQNPQLPWNQRDYYPVVGKAWEATAGYTNNLPNSSGEIFLPLVRQGTLQPLSTTAETTIAFTPQTVAEHPELAGVEIYMPPNNMVQENGNRGGMVGMTPVPSDRLPEPLPPGIVHTIDISIQTDGAQNFDRPVPVRFPNLPDPATGLKLPPGAKTALMSYDHDVGEWVIQGTMTVTEDGIFLVSDPGTGVRKPGWHGVGPPTTGPGPPGPCSGATGGPAPLPQLRAQAACKQACYIEADLSFNDCLRTAAKETGICAATGVAAGIGYCKLLPHPKVKLGCALIGGGGFALGCGAGHLYLCLDDKSKRRQLCDMLPDCNPPTPPCPVPSPSPPLQQAASVRLQSVGSGLTAETFDRIGVVYKMLLDLIYPYSIQSIVVPEEIIDKVTLLVSELDKLAGGSFLELAYKVRLDIELSAAPFLSAGNAPEYPIAYCVIARRGNDEELILRGSTQPYGEYRLFLPPDAQIEAVFFYDRVARSFGLVLPFLRESLRFVLPRVTLYPVQELSLSDFDSDGLGDVVEITLGTNPARNDSDSDGVGDGAEVDQGTDPLDGKPARTGILASASVPGAAVDVCALNDIVIVAGGAAGVTVFNVLNELNPVRVIEVDTPGDARRVSCDRDLIAVADGPAGLAIIDISDPPNARITHQINLGGSATAVTSAGGIAYVGTSLGEIVAVEMNSGTVIDRLRLIGPVVDVAVDGDLLLALAGSALTTISLLEPDLQVAGLVSGIPGNRLTAGGGLAYAVAGNGHKVIDISNPAGPVLLNTFTTAQRNWVQLVPNGSGLGVAVVAALAGTADADIYLHDLRPGGKGSEFLTSFPTPASAEGVSLYNGLAYVADGTAGLHVINYLAYDSKGLAPTIRLDTSLRTNEVGRLFHEEGQPFRLTASVTDDVQVRNVEFYIDGQRVLTDGSFPFESRLVAPLLTPSKASFTIRAKATDTGGNATWSDEVAVQLRPDATAPVVRHLFPEPSEIVPPGTKAFFVLFNEPMAAGTINAGNLTITFAGADNIFATTDDLPLTQGAVSYRVDTSTAAITFPSALGLGLYRGVVSNRVADLAGNRLEKDFVWTFAILASGPDDDVDGDDASNADELRIGLNPLVADTDGDGWVDGVELADGTSATNPSSRPPMTFLARPAVEVLRQSAEMLGTAGAATALARPAVEVLRPSPEMDGSAGAATFLARPPVEILRPTPDMDGSAGPATFFARPPVEITRPAP